MPVFDDHRLLLVDWFERIDTGGTRNVSASVAAALKRLRRVRKSARHARLAEFLEQTLLALRADETEGARYILLTALAAFGWAYDLTGMG
jgi:hypothetical protein